MKSVRFRPLAIVVLVIAVAVASTGCSSEDDTAERGTVGNNGGTTGDALVGWEELPVMGRAYRTPLEEAVRRQRAAGIAMIQAEVDCMVSRGFVGYSVNTSPPENVAFLAVTRARSEEEARNHGLGIADFFVMANTGQTGEPVLIGEPNDSDASVSDPDRATALEQAVVECRGETETVQNDVSALIDSYRFEVLGQPEIQTAFDAWQACMADSGYEVTSFSELRDSIKGPMTDAIWKSQSQSPSGDEPLSLEQAEELVADTRPKEVDAALAQVACDAQELSPVLSRWAELETAWQSNHSFELEQVPPESLDIWPLALHL